MPATSTSSAKAVAMRVFEIEAQAISALSGQLDADFESAVGTILASSGRTIICGMGKSGIIGRKLAATLASTGTPAFFMHPAEAFHGDLGMVTSSDVFVAISNSGSTREVIKLLPFLKDNGNALIAITGDPASALAKAASFHLNVAVREEACPLQLAPTASTTAALAMCDALAVALMEARQFKPENFARFHPGGALGRRLLQRVEHEMVSNDLPLIGPDMPAVNVLQAITRSNLGLAIVEREAGWGIITDGDLRRGVARYGATFFERKAEDLMTAAPATISSDCRVEVALEHMEELGISALLVVDVGRLLGVFKK